jgi:hypothetical protein
VSQVAKVSSGTSYTQFLIGDNIVHMSWTSGTATAPTITVKAGPDSGGTEYFVPGWETLETKGDKVVHVLYRVLIEDVNALFGGSHSGDRHSYRLVTNDATGTGAVWTAASSALWQWTFDNYGTTVNFSNSWRQWNSATGNGTGKSMLVTTLWNTNGSWQAFGTGTAYLDYWGDTAQYITVPPAEGRVGTVTVSTTADIAVNLTGMSVNPVLGRFLPQLRGQVATTAAGTLQPQLAGLSATVQQGTVVGTKEAFGVINTTTTFATVAQGSVKQGVERALTGQAVSTQQGFFLFGLSAVVQQGTLSGLGGYFGILATPSTTMTVGQKAPTPVIAVTLTGQAATVQQQNIGNSRVLTGQSVTVQQKAIGNSRILLGQEATTQAGTLTASASVSANVTLTGEPMTGQAGNVGPATAVRMTGQAATAQQQTFAAFIDVVLTGTGFTLSQGFISFGIDKILSALGVSATGVVGNVGAGEDQESSAHNLFCRATSVVELTYTDTAGNEVWTRSGPDDTESVLTQVPTDLIGG